MSRSRRTIAGVVLGALTVALPASADVTLKRGAEAIDPARVSVAAKQAELGTQVDRLFEYVRDRIRQDAYPGVLRGATGVLISEAGNAADKAILLHDLLTRAGHRARFAHGTLAPADAVRVVMGALALPTPPAGAPALDARTKAFVDALQGDVGAQSRVVFQVLADGGVAVPRDARGGLDAATAEARDHYWVQYLRGNDWIDLDPSLPTSRIGARVTEPRETLDRLPEALFHRVTIRVTVEEARDGAPRRRALLVHGAPAADLAGTTVLLTHQPGVWTQPRPLNALAAATDAITNTLDRLFGPAPPATPAPAAARENKATPVLMVGKTFKAGAVFDITHPANEATGSPQAPLGEWLEFEFKAPDGTTSTTERAIFDRIGFAARQRGQRTAAPAPLGLQHPLAAVFCLSFYTGPLSNPALFDATAKPTTETVPGQVSRTVSELGRALATVSHVVSVVSDRMTLPLTANGQPAVVLSTAPRLIISALRASPSLTTVSVDLRYATYRALTSAPALADRSFALQVMRGVIDGVVEARAVDFLFGGPPPPKLARANYSTSRVFRESAGAGIRPRLLQAAAPNDAATFGEEPAARMRAALAQRKLVLVPERQVPIDGRPRAAWWEIDRATGATVAVTGDGLHQDATEFNVIITRNQSVEIITWGAEGPEVFTTLPTMEGMNAIVARLLGVGWKLLSVVNFYVP